MLRKQGWVYLFESVYMCLLFRSEVAEFYARLSLRDGSLTTKMNRVEIVFDEKWLGNLF